MKDVNASSTRDRIMVAAQTLFAANGVKETTTREIARLANVAEGSIYRHFANKEDLAWRIFRSYHIKLATQLQTSANENHSLAVKIESMVKTFFKHADEQWSAFSYYLSGQQYYAAKMDAESLHPFKVVKDVLICARKNNEIPDSNIELLSAMAVGCVHQIVLNKQYGRINGKLSRYSKEVSAAIVRLVCVSGEGI